MVTFTAADFPVEDDAVYFMSVAGHQSQWELDDRTGVWFCARTWPGGDRCTTERPVGADLLGVTCQRTHIQPLAPGVDKAVDERENLAVNDLSKPCPSCRDGRHTDCTGALCGCIADHPDDSQMMRGFKQLKRELHPERAAEVRGGW